MGSSFLWKGEAGSAVGAKINWLQVCKPKTEGGLGLKNLSDWNIASFARLIWLLFGGSESLWIAWVKMHLVKGKCFWIVKAGTIALGIGEKLLNLDPFSDLCCSM